MTEVIEVMIEAGMSPADEHDVSWVRERWDGVVLAKEEFGAYVVAVYDRGEMSVAVASASGLVHASVTFPAPDGELDAFRAAAALAAIQAWSD